MKCSSCPNQAFLTVDDDGSSVISAGPIRRAVRHGRLSDAADDSCWFLAADFDEGEWRRDVGLSPTRASANGSPRQLNDHVRETAPMPGFFSQSRAGSLGPASGRVLLHGNDGALPESGSNPTSGSFQARTRCRLGGFGNFIALPFGKTRKGAGNSIFIDGVFSLSRTNGRSCRNRARLLARLVDELRRGGAQEKSCPCESRSSKKTRNLACAAVAYGRRPHRRDVAQAVTLVRADQIYVPRDELPAFLIARLIRLAAFQKSRILFGAGYAPSDAR